jgi:hypothetical protein
MVGESIGLALGVSPVNVVTHLVVHHAYPLPFRVILAAPLPILRVDEVDGAVLVGLSCCSAPVEILVPLDPRTLQAVEFTHQRHPPPELQGFVTMKKA